MREKPIVQIVAEALAWHMAQNGLNATTLGKLAKVAPNTVTNFLRPLKRVDPVSTDKQPSGKLGELERIAKALGVPFTELVSDLAPEKREERQRMEAALKVLQSGSSAKPESSEAPSSRQSGKRLAA